MRVSLTEPETLMILRCIEEYRCTLTPNLDWFQEEDAMLKRIEHKLPKFEKVSE